MSDARRLLTNASKGELDPLLEGRPDLAAYFEGGSKIENFNLLRQGGLDRRPGLRLIAKVKDKTKDAILFPFESSVENSYIVEFGDLYNRFIKGKTQLLGGGGLPVEIVSPYAEDILRTTHFAQLNDVLFLWNRLLRQQRLSRISDTSWSLQPITYLPPPSFQAKTDISGGTITLTPGAVSGLSVIFAASAPVFFEADVGRQIVYGASRGIITALGASGGDIASPNDHVRVDIIDAFPNTNPIPAGEWLLDLSPQTTLNPDKKEPIGAKVGLAAGSNAFRAADVGKYISIYGGLVKITTVTDPLNIIGEILSVMEGAEDADPPATVAGAWTLEVESWSIINGFPATGDFWSGRQIQASTFAQPNTWWASEPDDYNKYATGVSAGRAVEYTIATKGLNPIQWLANNLALFVGTAGTEHRITSGKDGEALGGDKIPFEEKSTEHGSSPIQPTVISRRVIFVDRSRKQIYSIAFNIEEDGFDALELTGPASHITGTGIRLGPSAFAKRPDSRLYWVRDDGELITLTYFHHEKVIGFTRIVTDGLFRAVACVPQTSGKPDLVYCIVERTIQGVQEQYIEVFDDDATELADRPWTSLQTDSAVLYDLSSSPTSFLTNLGHLEGKLVDVILGNSYIGQKLVVDGQIELDAVWDGKAEVGLHYDSEFITMKPAVEGQMVEGLTRVWKKIWARLRNTIGGRGNGQPLEYVTPGGVTPYTGDMEVTTEGISDDGKISIKQDQPYPMTILAVFGDIQFGNP
jgi:hypothetical protein